MHLEQVLNTNSKTNSKFYTFKITWSGSSYKMMGMKKGFHQLQGSRVQGTYGPTPEKFPLTVFRVLS